MWEGKSTTLTQGSCMRNIALRDLAGERLQCVFEQSRSESMYSSVNVNSSKNKLLDIK